MVCVCGVDGDVGGGGFGGEEGRAVEVAVDEADGWVLGGYFCAFVGVADEGCDGEVGIAKVWMKSAERLEERGFRFGLYCCLVTSDSVGSGE